jgi:hypothetical protein
MKLNYLYLVVLPILIGLFILTASSSIDKPEGSEGNKSLIKFSHSLHIDLTDCESCHSAVLTSISLKDRLLPNHDNCIGCHDVDDSDNCNTCHYEDVYEPLIQTKSKLIFNHNFHLDDQKIECTTCHQDLEEVDYSFEAAGVLPQMETCYSCHNDRNTASNACESCHISTADLIPQNHKSAGFISSHKFAANSIDANCIMCHDNNNSCQECHVSTTALSGSNAPSDFYQPYSPSNFTDGAKRLQIVRVHELNYRFIHGIDAKGKTAECQSCHQVETFCSTCHQSELKDYGLGGIMPASHLKPNFFTIGVGSGGGEHATLARRDIERCSSCHDTYGGDPTCITCHLDSDGVKGTNPKTHTRNFLRDVRGDWHDSQGSICFNCHTSVSPLTPAGIGFCGYCHGAK